MKKFLIAAAASLLIFGGQPAEAADVGNLGTQNVETQELGQWAHFRDKHILGRETENERRDRKDWERRHPDRRYEWERRERERREWERRERERREWERREWERRERERRERDRYRYGYPPPPPGRYERY